MSATSQSSTIRFFGALKNLFSKPAPANGMAKPQTVTPVRPTPARPTPAPVPVVKAAANHEPFNQNHNGQVVVLSLQSVIAVMSQELRAKVCAAVSDDLSVSVPVDKILSQLAKGSVKIPFGEVRRAAPHVFSTSADHDHLQVMLPLAQIMSRISPSLLPRRNSQKQQVELSDEIVSPFNIGAQGLTISPANAKPVATAQPIPKRVPPLGATPVARTVTPRSVPATLPVTGNTNRISKVQAFPAPAPAPKASPAARPVTPVAPAPSPVKPSATFAFTPITPIAPDEPAPQAESRPIPMPGIRRVVPGNMNGQTIAAGEATPITPLSPVAAPVVAAPAPVAPSGPPVNVPVSALVQEWPETLRQEIVRLNLAASQLAVPLNLLESGLKRGRVAFQWKQLRSWIIPAVAPTPSVHDEIEVSLPLKVIAPLFLSRKKSPVTETNSVAVDESIPNLFFGFPQPDSAPPVAAPAVLSPLLAPAPKPVDTNYYVFEDNSDTAIVDQSSVKRHVAQTETGTEFITKYATPNEIISRAAALDGVAGALIALPDGLMVASKIPEDQNGDTLAAFLPHLFGKMTQCTKELRMGELNNLHFTVGNIPWKVFRVNAVFFAAFGRVGNPLPTAQLASLAGELDHKNKS